MNGLVPVLIAVLLAEFGPRAALYADARLREPTPWIIAASVIAASVAGGLTGSGLTAWADAFLIAIALAFAAFGQVQNVRARAGTLPVALAFWQGGTPLLAFAFAARFGAPAVAAGALMGLIVAAILTRAAGSTAVFRWIAAAALAIATVVVAVGALRLT
jgi:hypothetical protein